MDTSICVPLTLDGAERERNWNFLQVRYERLYPDWEVVVGHQAEPWSKGAALCDAVERSRGEALVIADADMMVRPEVLPEAVASLNEAAWVVPHGRVYRLSDEITERVIAGDVSEPERVSPQWVVRRPYTGVRGGGLVVLTRKAWETVGGIDPRFIGWGGEDLSFGRALHTLCGPVLRWRHIAWHLWHRDQAIRARRRGSPENEALAGRYRTAFGNPEAMRAIVEEICPSPA